MSLVIFQVSILSDGAMPQRFTCEPNVRLCGYALFDSDRPFSHRGQKQRVRNGHAFLRDEKLHVPDKFHVEKFGMRKLELVPFTKLRVRLLKAVSRPSLFLVKLPILDAILLIKNLEKFRK